MKGLFQVEEMDIKAESLRDWCFTKCICITEVSSSNESSSSCSSSSSIAQFNQVINLNLIRSNSQLKL
jgi:hypothetical protein